MKKIELLNYTVAAVIFLFGAFNPLFWGSIEKTMVCGDVLGTDVSYSGKYHYQSRHIFLRTKKYGTVTINASPLAIYRAQTDKYQCYNIRKSLIVSERVDYSDMAVLGMFVSLILIFLSIFIAIARPIYDNT